MISQKDNEEGKLFVGGELRWFNSFSRFYLASHCGVRWIWCKGRIHWRYHAFELLAQCTFRIGLSYFTLRTRKSIVRQSRDSTNEGSRKNEDVTLKAPTKRKYFLFIYISPTLSLPKQPAKLNSFTLQLFSGLSWDTQSESLQRYFSRYGEVIDCVVMKNNETGRSRGFGFMWVWSDVSSELINNWITCSTFADPDNVQRALENCPHNLDGRTIDPK